MRNAAIVVCLWLGCFGNNFANAHPWRVGVHFHSGPWCAAPPPVWYAPSPVYDSAYFFSPWGSYYRTGFSSVRYDPWGWAPVVYPGVVVQQTVAPSVIVVDRDTPRVDPPRRRIVAPPPPRERDVFDVLQDHADRREGIPREPDDGNILRPVSASSRAGQARSKQAQAEGDRWLREGQFVKAYLRYLEAQRAAEDRGDVYFRQAFALVALGRYSHAVLKLKRGLQVDPHWPQHADSLDHVFGVENLGQKSEFLQRVADWADANIRDADRLFLMGVLLFCDDNPRAAEFFRAAEKLSGPQTHLKPFVSLASGASSNGSDRRTLPSPPSADRTAARRINAPPPPIDEPTIAPKPATGPRLPGLEVPPEPDRRELILPDVLLPK